MSQTTMSAVTSARDTPAHQAHGVRLRDTWPIHAPQAVTIVASYVLLTALWTGMGKLLVGPLDDSAIVDRDKNVSEWFAERRTSGRDTASLIGSWLSETIVKIAVTALLALVMLKIYKRWLEPLVLALPLILEASVFITTTKIVGRPRPDVPRLDTSPVGSSFPSGHVAAATVYLAIAVIVFWHTRTVWIRGAAVVLTAAIAPIVAVARLYRGMHFLSDVVAGAALGAVTLIVTTLILARSPQGRRALGGETEPSS